ncbi:NAD-specific glutamate dehydrogenase [Cyberlindnera fabianii]|uniref:NAD-specific glutamate dehydrogenase n=1 Tax=Cyberlindnera fabianii TaxID=36022 RepID=A0A1V2L3D0_CYBFA|nr:NAD-specific glutamate dehydrogenase [Cyberlindnera fabianii]
MSSLDKRPLSLVMVILLVLPVPFSKAETFKIPDGSVEVNTLKQGVNLNGGLSRGGQGSLGSLSGSSQSSQRSLVRCDVLLVLSLELVSQVVNKFVIKVLTTQVCVTCSSLDLEDTIIDGQKGDIESTTTQVENQNVVFTLALLVQTVGNSSGSWLVDDTKNVQTSNETGILNGVLWVHGSLILSSITNETLSVGKGNVRWSGTVTLVVGDDLNTVISVVGHTGVCGTQINSDSFAHLYRVSPSLILVDPCLATTAAP